MAFVVFLFLLCLKKSTVVAIFRSDNDKQQQITNCKIEMSRFPLQPNISYLTGDGEAFKSTKFLEDADEKFWWFSVTTRHVSLLHSQDLLLHSRDLLLHFP